MIGNWIGRLGEVWAEGQFTEVRRRPGTNQIYTVLRDLDAQVSMSVVVPTSVEAALGSPLTDGQRVLVRVRPEFWSNRGSLQLRAHEIRAVGIGELLAQIERLKQILRAEGLFDRKQQLPFLPRKVGLICGRNSAAEKDVTENARIRWPLVDFEIREVAVQGKSAAGEVRAALIELDAMPEVDVIIITRGGGSVEDLLPFSDEGLVRAAAAARTPIVSAIGHEQDQPLLDLVADLRASTPTDAAKRVVPDMAAELELMNTVRERMHRAITAKIEAGENLLEATRQRPALNDPLGMVQFRAADIDVHLERSRRAFGQTIAAFTQETVHLRAQIKALSPQATLDRGYAVVQKIDAGNRVTIVRSPTQVLDGDELRIRVAGGDLRARAALEPEPAAGAKPRTSKPRTRPKPTEEDSDA